MDKKPFALNIEASPPAEPPPSAAIRASVSSEMLAVTSSIVQRLSVSAGAEPEVIQLTPRALAAVPIAAPRRSVQAPPAPSDPTSQLSPRGPQRPSAVGVLDLAALIAGSPPRSSTLSAADGSTSPSLGSSDSPAPPPPRPLTGDSKSPSIDSLGTGLPIPASPRSAGSSSPSPSASPRASPRPSPRSFFDRFRKSSVDTPPQPPVHETDHLALCYSPDVQKLLNQFETLVSPLKEAPLFSDVVLKRNEHDKTQERVLLITNCALYNLKRKNLSKCRRRIPLHNVERVIVSKVSNEFVVLVHREHAYRFCSDRKDEIVRVLTESYPTSLASPRSQARSPRSASSAAADENDFQLFVEWVDAADLKQAHITKDEAARLRHEEYLNNIKVAQDELNETKVMWAQKARERERRKAEAVAKAQDRERQRQKQMESEMEALMRAQQRDRQAQGRSPRPGGDGRR